MRILAALVLLFTFSANALTTAELFSRVCASSTVNNQLVCGAAVSSVVYDTNTQQITLASDTAISGTAPLIVMFVESGQPAPARADFYAPGLQQLTTLTDLVPTPADVAGRIYAVQMKNFSIGEVVNTIEFTRSATVSAGVKFNPGHYFNSNFGDRQFIDNPELLAPLLVSTGVCVAGSQVGGIMIRFKAWALYEPTVGDRKGNNLIDWVLNHFASGDCRGTANPPRLGVSMLWSTFGPDSYLNRNIPANVPGCVPSDHPEWGLVWKKEATSNNGRCIIRMWDQPDGIAAINDTVADMAARYDEHPLFEWVNFKGEGSLSIGQAGDAAYDADPEGATAIIRAEVRNQCAIVRAAAPRTACTIGSNYYNSTDPAVIQTRVDEQTAFMDATGGIGSQHPDSYSNANGAAKPRTSWQARLPGFVVSETSPRQAKYMVVAETQRPSTTCAGDVQGCYDWMSKPGFEFTNNYNPADMIPPQTAGDYSGATASHTVWLVQFDDPFSLANIQAVLAAENYEQWQEACPSTWSACVTGGI